MRKAARIAALLALAAGVVLAILYRDALSPSQIHAAVGSSPYAPLVFVGLQILASLFFVPRTVLGIAAGLLFGFAWGLAWALVGAELGAAAGFALVRWMGVAGTLDMTPRLGGLIEKAEHGGWRSVAIVRLTPLPHSVVNTALALTNLNWRDYLIGSFLGMLPMTLAQVDIGAAGGVAFESSAQWVVACLLLAAGLGASFLIKRATANWR